MCGDPVVRSFDGGYFMMLEPSKYLMFEWDMMRHNPCKFQMRCVVMDDICNEPA